MVYNLLCFLCNSLASLFMPSLCIHILMLLLHSLEPLHKRKRVLSKPALPSVPTFTSSDVDGLFHFDAKKISCLLHNLR